MSNVMSQHTLSFPAIQPSWLPHLDLAFTMLAAILWLVWPQWGPWPLVFAAVPWLLRWWETGRLTFFTPLFAPLCLFMLTAVVGLWAAYNPTAAWAKFWLLVASILLFNTLANQPPAQLWFIAKLLNFLCVLIASYFLLTHNWHADPTYINLFDVWAEKWMQIRPLLNMPSLHPNQAAGFIVVLVPFTLAIAWQGKHQRSVIRWGATAITIILILFALLLTGSRGAWLALTVALVFWGWSILSQSLANVLYQPHSIIFWLGLGLAVLICGAFIMLSADPLSLANSLPGAASANSRLAIFNNTLHLLGTFPITGGGLGAFGGLYSQYILVIPQSIFTYAHNLFLDIALEQGMFGLLAFLVIVSGSFWLLGQNPDRPAKVEQYSLLRWAVVAGLVVMLGHGLVDDPFYGYRGTPLLWLLPGIAVALNRAITAQSTFSQLSPRQWAIIAFVLLFSIVANFSRPRWQAAWVANLGAVEMARAELTNWPTNQWDDGRSLTALQSAEQLFIKALQIDPTNRTAHYRLGMIEMLRRDFGAAVSHFEAAYQADNGHKGIRKSLAYSYIWNDQLDKAQILLVNIPEARQELKIYIGWWETQNRDDLAAQAAQMVNLLK